MVDGDLMSFARAVPVVAKFGISCTTDDEIKRMILPKLKAVFGNRWRKMLKEGGDFFAFHHF
jgi:hypothetical protein